MAHQENTQLQNKPLSEGQRAYEARRAAKAGTTLDKHLAAKERKIIEEARARARAAEPPKPAKPPGMLKRLIDRAHRPLKPPPSDPKSKARKP